MANDEPAWAPSLPRTISIRSPASQPITTPEDETLVVEAAVNSLGQVYDFRIVSGPQGPEVRKQVVDRLLSSVFRPASVFGVPNPGSCRDDLLGRPPSGAKPAASS